MEPRCKLQSSSRNLLLHDANGREESELLWEPWNGSSANTGHASERLCNFHGLIGGQGATAVANSAHVTRVIRR